MKSMAYSFNRGGQSQPINTMDQSLSLTQTEVQSQGWQTQLDSNFQAK